MKALVIKSTGSWYDVEAEDGQLYKCRIKGKFRVEKIKSTNPIVVGDYVGIVFDSKTWMIVPRRTTGKKIIFLISDIPSRPS